MSPVPPLPSNAGDYYRFADPLGRIGLGGEFLTVDGGVSPSSEPRGLSPACRFRKGSLPSTTRPKRGSRASAFRGSTEVQHGASRVPRRFPKVCPHLRTTSQSSRPGATEEYTEASTFSRARALRSSRGDRRQRHHAARGPRARGRAFYLRRGRRDTYYARIWRAPTRARSGRSTPET